MAVLYVNLGLFLFLLIGELLKSLNLNKNNGVIVQSKLSNWLSIIPILLLFPLEQGLDDQFHIVLFILLISVALIFLFIKLAGIGYITIYKSTGHRTADTIRKVLHRHNLNFSEKEYLEHYNEVCFILSEDQLMITIEWTDEEKVFTAVKVKFKKAWRYPGAEVLREDIVEQLRSDLGERSFSKKYGLT